VIQNRKQKYYDGAAKWLASETDEENKILNDN